MYARVAVVLNSVESPSTMWGLVIFAAALDVVKPLLHSAPTSPDVQENGANSSVIVAPRAYVPAGIVAPVLTKKTICRIGAIMPALGATADASSGARALRHRMA